MKKRKRQDMMTAERRGREERTYSDAVSAMSELTGIPAAAIRSRRRDRRVFSAKAVLAFCTWTHVGHPDTSVIAGCSRGAAINRVETARTAVAYYPASGFRDIKEMLDIFSPIYEDLRARNESECSP